MREGLIKLDKIPENTSLAYLLVKRPIQSTKATTKEQEELDDKDRQFKMMSAQWEEHPDLDWRIKATAHAEKWKDKLQSARDLLDLAKKTETVV